MADGGDRKGSLPWGMSAEVLKPNSVQAISQTKLKAFSLGRTNPVKKSSPFVKKKEEREQRRKLDAKEAAVVFEEFMASFDDSTKAGKTFVRGSDTVNPDASEEPSSSGTTAGDVLVYKPSKFVKASEESKPVIHSTTSVSKKPQKKKVGGSGGGGDNKKKSILELFREELKRAQEERKERHVAREKGDLPLDADAETTADIFKVDEYKEYMKGSFDTGDPLTTNLYVGNINPKMNEEMLCQIFGKFGPLASVKVMWPRTEEERSRNRNCGFVAFMKRQDGDRALEAMKGTTIMDYEIQVGWGKAVPLPPHPIYVPPNMAEEETAKAPDPPSGLPFNAQPRKKSEAGKGGKYGSVPPPDPKNERFEDLLYNAVVRVVIPTDIDLLQLIHRMIEFVIRDGPMFEAMIMNREISNPKFQFLFDNQSPAHIYYRWKLFSILQGDSPETWRTDEFRMFENGSLWKPPPLKNLRSKILPPITEEVVKRGQLTSKKRDTLEDQLRSISMEREKIGTTMIWCLDHAESAEEIVDCISEALCIAETPLPMKIARLYLTNDILQNCSPSVSNASNFRRGFEAKLLTVMEHFHSVLKGIASRMRAESFKRRVLSCLRAWDKMSVYHFNFVDKLRETFIGKTHEELEKLKAFETVAALISTKPEGVSEGDIDGVPLMDDQPIDFSKGVSIDGVPMAEDLDGEPLPNPDLDGVPLGKEEDLDGIPMEEPTPAVIPVRSKWELVDYGDDSDDQDQIDASPVSPAQDSGASLSEKQKKELLAELDERKRRILRDVELKVVELTDALEASGSYSKAEIAERVDKYRDRLMQEAVEPKWSPEPDSKTSDKRRGSSRSPSPSTLAKYNLASSPKHFKEQSSRGKSPEKSSRRHSKSPERSRKSPERSRKRSRSPGSPTKRKRSSSPSRKRHRSPRSPSPKSRRSRSVSPPPSSKRRKHSTSPKRRRSHSRSPARKRSQSPARKRSRSRSPGRKRSPARRRSRSRSPAARKRSRSPKHGSSKRRSRSKSPRSHRHRSRSWSPGRSSSKKSRRSRSRSRSPHKSSKSSSKKSGKH